MKVLVLMFDIVRGVYRICRGENVVDEKNNVEEHGNI